MLQSSPSIVPLTAERSPWLRGPIRVPGSRAVGRLALLAAALARGESVIERLGGGAEIEALATALGQLGVPATRRTDRWHVQGIGVGGFLPPDGPIDMAGLGDAAAAALLALLGAHDFDTEIKGLRLEPVTAALLDFLSRGGARVEIDGEKLKLRGPRFGIPHDLRLPPDALALKAPLLLQALLITGTNVLGLPPGGTDATETVLAAFGAKIVATESEAGVRLAIEGMSPLRSTAFAVPGDPALAAYPAVAALIAPDSEITVEALALDQPQMALLDALQMLGGDVTLEPGAHAETLTLRVKYAPLTGIPIPAELGVAPEDCAILAIAAAFAEGETLLESLGEGAHRYALTRALRDNGIDCEERPGGLAIRGQPTIAGGGKVATHLDPKLAMAFLVLGMAATAPVTIDDGAVLADTFPDFTSAFEHIGASFAGAA